MTLNKLKALWWLNPIATILFAVVPFIVSGHLMAGVDFTELWNTQKYLDRESAIIEGLFLLTVIGGVLLARFSPLLSPAKSLAGNHSNRLRWLYRTSVGLTLAGYLVWAAYSYSQGVGLGDVLAVIRGEPGAVYKIRDTGGTLAGISTMTQFGMSAMIFGALLARQEGWGRIKYVLGSILFLSVIRGLLWSERLALIELSVPLTVLLFQQYASVVTEKLRRILIFTPALGAGGLYLYFTVSEYFRSWSSHYSTMGMSLWFFSWSRLSGYYITALNNGALAFRELGVLPAPYTVIEWFWKFPGISKLLPYNTLFSTDPDAYMDSLKTLANPEFNNPSGIFPYASDFGVFLFAVFWLAVGFGIGKCYFSFRRGGLGGSLFYPLLYISLLEMSRVAYLTNSRTLPSWFMLIIAYAILPRKLLVARPARKTTAQIPSLLRSRRVG